MHSEEKECKMSIAMKMKTKMKRSEEKTNKQTRYSLLQVKFVASLLHQSRQTA